MRTLLLVLALCLPALARAQDEQNYKFSGFVVNGPSLSGSVTVDNATGAIISAYVQSFGTSHIALDQVAHQQSFGYAYVFSLTPAAADCPRLVIGERTTPQSLAHYPGGPIGPHSVLISCDGSADRVIGGLSPLP